MSALDDYRPRIQEMTQRTDDAIRAVAGGGHLAEAKRILTEAQRDLRDLKRDVADRERDTRQQFQDQRLRISNAGQTIGMFVRREGPRRDGT